jgi:hypothetical protein
LPIIDLSDVGKRFKVEKKAKGENIRSTLQAELGQLNLTYASADFSLVLIFNSEGGGVKFLRNVRIPFSYMELQPRRPHFP